MSLRLDKLAIISRQASEFAASETWYRLSTASENRQRSSSHVSELSLILRHNTDFYRFRDISVNAFRFWDK